MKSSYLSYFWWFFLPRAVGWVQWFCYSIAYRAGDPKPQPGSVTFVRHYRQIYTSIVVIYVLFTVYQADWDLQREGNLYQTLGVPVNVEESGLKTRFRTLTRLFHPDKATGDVEVAHNYFVLLKDARDLISDPVKRFAYDRLGPDVLIARGKAPLTIKEYVYHAATSSILPYYLGTTLVLFALNILGWFQSLRYWRFYTLFAVLVFELHTLTRSSWPTALTYAVNPVLTAFKHPALLPYQLISIIRTSAVSLFIGANQLQNLPSLQPPSTRSAAGLTPAEAENLVHNQLNYIENLTKTMENESQRLLEMESAPFFGGEDGGDRETAQMKKVLLDRLQEWLVQNVLRSNQQVRDAEGRVLARRRQGVPAGARGTK